MSLCYAIGWRCLGCATRSGGGRALDEFEWFLDLILDIPVFYDVFEGNGGLTDFFSSDFSFRLDRDWGLQARHERLAVKQPSHGMLKKFSLLAFAFGKQRKKNTVLKNRGISLQILETNDTMYRTEIDTLYSLCQD